jgi:hypothetical protein
MPSHLFRRFAVVFVLVTMIGGVVMPLFGDLHADGDLICADDPIGATPHHQTTQIESIRPSVAGDHCAVCHMQRAMSGAADDAKRYVAGAAVAPWTVLAVVRATRELARHDVPARAPPSSFL